MKENERLDALEKIKELKKKKEEYLKLKKELTLLSKDPNV